MYFRDAGQVVWYYKQAICLWLKNYFGKTDIARESVVARIWQAWTALSVLFHEKQVVVFCLFQNSHKYLPTAGLAAVGG